MSSISRFHIQIIQLFAFVFVWVHWDACLQYGACASQAPGRCTHPPFLHSSHLTVKCGQAQAQGQGPACRLAQGMNGKLYSMCQQAVRKDTYLPAASCRAGAAGLITLCCHPRLAEVMCACPAAAAAGCMPVG